MNEINLVRVSVIDPISDAFNKTIEVLFRPFNIEKWFIIGFCAWLAGFGEGGGFNGTNFNYSNRQQTASSLNNFKNEVLQNLPFVIVIGAVIFSVIIGLTILFAWLQSRGKFMFLHCVAQNKAEVKIPWSQYADQANSLFVFLLILALIGFLCFIPLSIMLLLAFLPILNGGAAVPLGILAIVAIIFVMITAGIVLGLVSKFTKDFVVPIMYLQRITCMDAWRQFKQMLSANKGHFTLYILFQIVIGIAISSIVFAAALATCGCACCFLMIPYIGTILLLPVLVFKRSYSLYYLAQYGRALNVFVPHGLEEEATVLPEPEL